jgi:ribosomal protein S27AE
MREKCPKCGAGMELSRSDPDVGIMTDAWECGCCGHTEIADYDDPDLE